MLDEPSDLESGRIAAWLRTYWGIDAAAVGYLPLGAGGYHWRVEAVDGERWFVSAGRWSADQRAFVGTTLRTAATVRAGGLEFVRAPVPDRAGRVAREVEDGWTVLVLPWIDGHNPDFDGPERVAVARALGRLHAYAPVPEFALRWEPGYLQPELRSILEDLESPWKQGPFGESARLLFRRTVGEIHALMALHDRFVERLLADSEPWVVTHGEPHAGNTMVDTAGRAYLIDCDAMFVAPRERDLRLLLHGGHRGPRGYDNTAALAAYRAGAGAGGGDSSVRVRAYGIEAFRAEWHLIEISRYASLFRGPHESTFGTRKLWEALNGYLPVTPNWPELA